MPTQNELTVKPPTRIGLTEDAQALEAFTPQLNSADGTWVNNKTAAGLEGIETETLKRYRNTGIANPDRSLGCDRDGRVWRRPGNQSSHPWYLRSSLKSQKNSAQNRG